MGVRVNLSHVLHLLSKNKNKKSFASQKCCAVFKVPHIISFADLNEPGQ